MFFGLFKKKRKCLMVNDQLTIVLVNGTNLVLSGATREQFRHLNDLCLDQDFSDDDITEVYYDILDEIKSKSNTPLSKIIEKKEEEKQIVKKQEAEIKEKVETAKLVKREVDSKYSTLVASGDFTEKNGSLYMNGIPLSIPSLLVEKFIKLIKKVNDNDANALDQYCAHKNFWSWCSLNPNPESRENLFRYIQNGGLHVNKYGFFCAYRAVNKKKMVYKVVNEEKREADTNLSEFISNAYTKIKGQKKSPKNFQVCTTVENVYTTQKVGYVMPVDVKSLGNLAALHEQLTSSEAIQTCDRTIQVQHYTDVHTGTLDIVIGKEVSIDPRDCDWDNHNECSSGLHVGTKSYGCGDTRIMVLVNPMKVVAVPYQDGHKMRVWAYLPIAVLDGKEAYNLANNLDTLELGDEYYTGAVKELNQLLKNNTPKELKTHRYVAEFTPEELTILNKTVVDMKKVISDRVIKA